FSAASPTRICRRCTTSRRCTSAPRAGASGSASRGSGSRWSRPRRAGCPLSRATPAASQTPCGTARRGSSCRRKTRRRSPKRSPVCWLTLRSRSAWETAAGAPSRRTSTGTAPSATCAPLRLRLDDIRWFAPNRFCTLVVPPLRARGLSIALEGDAPARLAIAMDAQVAAAAYTYAVRHRSVLIHYLWDLPPWRLGRGRHDWVWHVFGRYIRVPRVGRRYAERPGYYSRLRFVAVHAREVWVPSAHTAASVQQRLGVACRRVPYCFDSVRFTPASAPRVRTGLLTVSRLTFQKNHAAVIRAAARFEPKLPVRFIGSGPEKTALE